MLERRVGVLKGGCEGGLGSVVEQPDLMPRPMSRADALWDGRSPIKYRGHKVEERLIKIKGCKCNNDIKTS